MTVARHLTEDFAVAAQITPDDIDDLKAEGFHVIVCNRPDGEVPSDLAADVMRAKCEEAGLAFVLNPLSHGSLSPEHIETQRDAAQRNGKVLAYCASGNRSSILWGLAMAGSLPTEEIIDRAAAAGYNLTGLQQTLNAVAAERTRGET